MMTRLLTLALAATGLSVGGFQLGTRQAQTSPVTEVVTTDLPADHAITVALKEPTSKVPDAEKARLRVLIKDMEQAKKVEAETRVKALNVRIAELEKQIVANRTIDLRLNDKKIAKIATMKQTGAKENNPTQVRFHTVKNPTAINRLQAIERERADKIVEDRFEAIAVEGMPLRVANRVRAETRAIRAEEGERGFALLIGLRERYNLGLTPKQVTQLQLLQADFLRRYAPLREETEIGLTFALVDDKSATNKMDVKAGVVDLKVTNEVKDIALAPVKAENIKSSDVVYSIHVEPTVKTESVKSVHGKALALKEAKITQDKALTYRLVLVNAVNDVDKRIQALKDEIDDKVYEILNDDQGKRLRRLVALSLSPNP